MWTQRTTQHFRSIDEARSRASVPRIRGADPALAYTPGCCLVSGPSPSAPDLVYDYVEIEHRTVVSDGTICSLRRHRPQKRPCRSWRVRRCCSRSSVAWTRSRSAWTPLTPREIIETIVPDRAGLRRGQPRRTSPRRAASRSRTACRSGLDIPIFHDDQHGTAIVVIAALESAVRLTSREMSGLRVVVSGAGAAGVAGDQHAARGGVKDRVRVADSQGLLCPGART